jgi:hypothetical protein
LKPIAPIVAVIKIYCFPNFHRFHLITIAGIIDNECPCLFNIS